MRILVTGGHGLLGREVVAELKRRGWQVVIADIVGSDEENMDICDLQAFVCRARELRPDAIVHCAAWTEVDACESDPDTAYRVNAVGARNAAIAARRVSAKFLHISTDYVFDGCKDAPYIEFDPVKPVSVYGASKEAGERLVREQTPDHFILRIAWLYGDGGRSFPATISRLARRSAAEGKPMRVVDDQWGTPTWSREVARQIAHILPTETFGTFHSTAQGETTWYGFAKKILDGLRIDVELSPCSTDQFPRPAPRPANSRLDNLCLRIQGMDVMRSWEAAWEEYVGGAADLSA